jgi:hypothetical protein
MRTGQAHYAFLSMAAAESAACLRRLSGDAPDPVWSVRLEEAADLFDRLSDVQNDRAALYAGRRATVRLRQLSRILHRGGYFGYPFVRMPPRALAKDLVVCLAGPWVQPRPRGNLEPL